MPERESKIGKIAYARGRKVGEISGLDEKGRYLLKDQNGNEVPIRDMSQYLLKDN
ncbi:hypothetical protein K9L16_02430 [Candidatus Pacearchaeota archaeon]|nr:hypothetical protein [Candidatus Pacearchaeota archaeon]